MALVAYAIPTGLAEMKRCSLDATEGVRCGWTDISREICEVADPLPLFSFSQRPYGPNSTQCDQIRINHQVRGWLGDPKLLAGNPAHVRRAQQRCAQTSCAAWVLGTSC